MNQATAQYGSELAEEARCPIRVRNTIVVTSTYKDMTARNPTAVSGYNGQRHTGPTYPTHVTH